MVTVTEKISTLTTPSSRTTHLAEPLVDEYDQCVVACLIMQIT